MVKRFGIVLILLISTANACGIGIPMLPHCVQGYAYLQHELANGTMEVLIDGVVYGMCDVKNGIYNIYCNGKSAAQERIKDGGVTGDVMYFILNKTYLGDRIIEFEYGGLTHINISFKEKITPLKINDVSPWTNTVEIYSMADEIVNLSFWRLEDCDGNYMDLSGTISPNEKLKLKVRDGFFETVGDEVKLKFLSQYLHQYITADRVEYGFQDAKHGNTSLTDFPAIPPDKCIRRIQDGYDTDDCMRDFQLYDISTESLYKVRGFILNDNDEKIYAVEVSVDGAKIKSDFYGFYSIDLPEGEYKITFSRDGYENKNLNLKVYNDMWLNITLRRKIDVFLFSGYVLDDEKHAVPEADLIIGSYRTKTDENGKFTLNLKKEKYKVIISKENFSTYLSEINITNDMNTTFVISEYKIPTLTSTLMINVSCDGKGVKDAWVVVMDIGVFCETDVNGTAIFKVLPGNYTIEVKCDGYGDAALGGVEVDGGSDIIIEFKIKRLEKKYEESILPGLVATVLLIISGIIFLYERVKIIRR